MSHDESRGLADEEVRRDFAAGVRPAENPRAGAEPKGYLPTLDGWRAVAILLVMACHAFRGTLAARGAVGVDIFFGLSGFLICSRLISERARNGHISLPAFYIRRTFRILPPYLAYLATVAVLTSLGVLAVNRYEFLSCLLFARNYLPMRLEAMGRFHGWYTGHFWSLAVEEHFYLLWPSLLVLLGLGRARRTVAYLSLAIAVWRVAEARLHLLDRAIPGVSFFLRTDIRLDGLLWGCWMALMLDIPAWKERFHRLLHPAVWLGLLVAVSAAVVLQLPLHMFWVALAVPFLLVGTVLRPESWAGRVLEWEPLRWIGRMSYSLYLWQQLFLMHEEQHRAPGLGILQSLPWNLLAAFGCALASYYLLEQPLIRVGHRLAKRASARGAEPARVAPSLSRAGA